jgi:23S rRNA pseudouridine1911/1915/1917 synthase
MQGKSFIIGREERGRSVAAVVRGHLRLSWPAARQLVRAQQVRLDGIVCVDPTRKVHPGQRLDVQGNELRPKRKRSPSSMARPSPQQAKPAPVPRSPGPIIRFADRQIVVVDKPAGLTTMRHAHEVAEFGERGRRFLPPTLADLLPDLLPKGKRGRPPHLRAVHRLDKETSGLVVFALTPEAASDLGRQMRAHEVERRYLALVRGRPKDSRIESYLVRDRGDGRRGSSSASGEGKRAVTHVRVLEELGDYSLVECRLETGRTHQVRIHLGEAGTPLCGEHIYDRPQHGRPLPDGSGAARPMLHAATLGFCHPTTGQWLSWTSPLPKDMKKLLTRLRSQRPPHGRR